MSRILFKCLKCSHEMSITAAWGDLSPKKCPKCKNSFIKNPDSLKVTKPGEVELPIIESEE